MLERAVSMILKKGVKQLRGEDIRLYKTTCTYFGIHVGPDLHKLPMDIEKVTQDGSTFGLQTMRLKKENTSQYSIYSSSKLIKELELMGCLCTSWRQLGMHDI